MEPSLRRRVASVRLMLVSNGTCSSCSYMSRGFKSMAFSTSVSRASLGGSRHLVASAAATSTSLLDTPSTKSGISFCNLILLRVSVPVLSEHSTVMAARSSTAESRVTIAFSSASARQPRAMVVVHTTRMAMGMEATSSTTQKAVTPRNGSPLAMRKKKVMTTSTTPVDVIASVMRCSSSSKFPGPPAWLMRHAVFPKNVSEPVAYTSASISPRVHVDPILARSFG
mmetsp:Transcript_32622/g.61318  ORF Transcript_32622/g.61318 Transcript_32622/m.61318 type:complete len:226 (+) Transcript_32622:1742-2419(+)